MASPKDAPYKLKQQAKSHPHLLATSRELSDYQKLKGISALRMAKLTKAKLADSTPL